MSSNFPTSLDSYSAPGQYLSTNPHSSLHQNADDAIVALETKVGVDSSAVTTTLDYKLKNAASVSPGHKHVTADITDAGTYVTTGSLIDYTGSGTPTGFLPCNGAAVSRSTYAALFAIIGTTYGSGDGATTFNVPVDYYNKGAWQFDAAASSTQGGSARTWTHTTSMPGRNNVLGVITFILDNPGGTVSAVTWGGKNMTLVTSKGQQNYLGFMYYIVNPPAGAQTISITFATATNCLACSATYFGVKSFSVGDTSASASVASGNLSVTPSITPNAAAQLIAVGACTPDTETTFTMSNGTARTTIKAGFSLLQGDLTVGQTSSTITVNANANALISVMGSFYSVPTDAATSNRYIKT